MNASEPHSTAPSGAPRPLVKSSHALSIPATMSLAGTPAAITAFISRAPSMCVAIPCPCAASATAFSFSNGQTEPLP